MFINSFGKSEVAGTIRKTLLCRVSVLLRNIISHIHFFVLSPDFDGVPNGVDHESTRV